MTGNENDRLAVVEAKVDRILTLLDDPDFGIRATLKAQDEDIQKMRYKIYVVLSAVGGAALLWAGALAKTIGG